MKLKHIHLTGIIITLAIQACSSTSLPQPTMTLQAQVLDEANTAVAATVQAAETSPQVSELAPTPTLALQTSTQTPSQEGATCTPAHPGAQTIPLPAGFGASINSLAITFSDIQGNPLGSKQTPNMTFLEPSTIHFAGSLSQGISALPLVYHSYENGGELRMSANDTTTPIVSTPNLIALNGGEGRATLVYSLNDSAQDGDGWVSSLYAGELSALANAQPVHTRSEGDGLVLYPLRAHIEAGSLQGVWYTLSMWGIGNIIFPPFNGLFYLDLAQNQVTPFLGPENRLLGFSPDQTTAAYAVIQGGQPGGISVGFNLKDLTDCQETFIAFNPSTNLGAGFLTIAPDNQTLAWLEAIGPDNTAAQMRLRVARAGGEVLVDSQNANLGGLAGGELPVFVRPTGWLAEHLLLLEVGVPSLQAPILVVWAPDPGRPLDPALGANQSAPLAEGVFAGFVYP
jgi:hypothetical protein